jgi:hypothetical protein
MASGRGNSKDAVVTDEQLAEVEYELNRNRIVEENEKVGTPTPERCCT